MSGPGPVGGFPSGAGHGECRGGCGATGAIARLLPAGVDLSDPVTGFAAVAERLAAGPGRRRWVLLVGDMHLLDSASAVLLRQLMDTGALLLIGTVRGDEPYGKAVTAELVLGALTAGDLTERGEIWRLAEGRLPGYEEGNHVPYPHSE